MIFMIRRPASAVPTPNIHAVTFAALYPPTTPLCTHALPVSGGHLLHVEESGSADGIAALVLHGGPGSGCSPLLRRFFDPARYRVICVDQRGSGASLPRGETAHNRTPDLLDDLRALRLHLGIDRWLVVGGSWGAALAIAHACDAPQAVSGLLLRAVFLARTEDIGWFFQGAREALPEAWQRFAAVAPAARRGDLLTFLVDAFRRSDPHECAALALAWWRWEQAMARQTVLGQCVPDPVSPAGEALAALVDRYRVQSHYLRHGCWLSQPSLLDRCARLPPVPTLLLHGLEDRVCRPEGALAAHARMPHSRLHWVDGAGHDPTHPAMAAATVAALDGFAAQGHFGVKVCE